MPIATFTAIGLVEHLNRLKLCLLVTGNHQLGDTLTILNDKDLLRKINQYHPDFAAIVCINGAW